MTAVATVGRDGWMKGQCNYSLQPSGRRQGWRSRLKRGGRLIIIIKEAKKTKEEKAHAGRGRGTLVTRESRDDVWFGSGRRAVCETWCRNADLIFHGRKHIPPSALLLSAWSARCNPPSIPLSTVPHDASLPHGTPIPCPSHLPSPHPHPLARSSIHPAHQPARPRASYPPSPGTVSPIRTRLGVQGGEV